MDAGEVSVRLEPKRLDAGGAEVGVTLDTHSRELDMDPAAGARLLVGDTPWPVSGWDGDGPGGHHREGTLRFEPAGSPSGTVELTLAGFPSPVTARWQLDG